MGLFVALEDSEQHLLLYYSNKYFGEKKLGFGTADSFHVHETTAQFVFWNQKWIHYFA